MIALTSYHNALDRLLARLPPVQPHKRALESAIGCIAAQDVVATQAVPARAIALRDGYGLHADEIAGASSYAPVALSSAPPFIAAGLSVPADCDCLVEASGLDLEGPLPQALVESFPGENLRRVGEDLASGTLILRAGERLAALTWPALQAAGLTSVFVRVPVICVQGDEGPLTAMLTAWLVSAGVALEGAPDLVVSIGPAKGDVFADHLALAPGREIAFSMWQNRPMVSVPARADLVLAAWVAVIRPALAQLSGQISVGIRLPLAQKIASRVGIAEIVALRTDDGHFVPLALGDLPLQSLLGATHVALIAAQSEGLAAGELLEAVPVRA